MAKKKKAKKPLTEEQKKEQARKKKEAAFKRKIKTTFMAAGFSYLPSNGKEFKIGHRVVELDYLFIYDNVVSVSYTHLRRMKSARVTTIELVSLSQ